MSQPNQVSSYDQKFKQEKLITIIFRQFLEHRLAVASAVLLLILISLSVFAPVIGWAFGSDYSSTDLLNKNAPPSASHPLGQDELGRDILMRLLYGGRISLLVGFISACGTAIIGTIIGAVAGFYGKKVDAFLMRVTDFFMALPILPLMIVVSAIDLEKVWLLSTFANSQYVSLIKIILVVTIFSWMQAARLVRGCVLSVKEREFVMAAESLGASNTQIIFSHILPNVISPVIVSATLAVGGVILYEAVLSFLGLGIQPPTPSWGNMLMNARENINSYPMLAFYPGFFILVTVISFNFLGDGLQDAIDPKAIKR